MTNPFTPLTGKGGPTVFDRWWLRPLLRVRLAIVSRFAVEALHDPSMPLDVIATAWLEVAARTRNPRLCIATTGDARALWLRTPEAARRDVRAAFKDAVDDILGGRMLPDVERDFEVGCASVTVAHREPDVVVITRLQVVWGRRGVG